MIIKSYLAEQNEKIFNNKLILIYGENVGLVEDLKKKIKVINSGSDINNANQENILKNKESFYEKVFNISLFKKQKIFFINQCDDKIIDLIQNIEPKINDQKFFLFANILEKKSKLRTFFDNSKVYVSLPCYQDNLISITKIIEAKLKGFDGLTQEIKNHLIDNCNLDRSKLYNELDKIFCYFENKKLSLNEIKNILNLKENDKFNDLKDTAIIGDKLRTNSLLNNNYLQEEKNILYVNLINQRLVKLKDIINLSNNGSLQKAIDLAKPPIFWKDKSIILEQLKKWNISKINLALEKTYNLEILLKSRAAINTETIIKKTIIDICNLANAA